MTPVAAESIPAHARAAIERASAATGVDFRLLVETARRESSFNANARAPTSSATGLFQFIDNTWLETVRRHGANHGLGVYANQIEMQDGRPIVRDSRLRQQILDLRFDPELSARMGAELARDNRLALERRLGRPVDAGEIYAAHVLGAAGAARLIDAASQGAPSAAVLFPREADANRWLFMTRDGKERSAQALLERLRAPFDAAPASRPVMVHEARASAVAPLRPALHGADVSKAFLETDLNQSFAEREAALVFVELLMAATRERALAIVNDGSQQDAAYAMTMYRRWAS